MARQDFELKAVLDGMLERGDKITLKTFTDAAGGGDRTRLAAVLKSWRKQNPDGDAGTLPVLPFAIQSALDTFIYRLQHAFAELDGQDADRMRRILNDMSARAEHDMNQANRRIGELIEERDALQEQLRNAEAGFTAARSKIIALEERVEDNRRQQDAAVSAAARERDFYLDLVASREADMTAMKDELHAERKERARLAKLLREARGDTT